MLLHRILTAVALLAVLLPAMLLAPPWVWGGVSLILLALAAVEWGSLLGSKTGGVRLGLSLCIAGGGYLYARMFVLPGDRLQGPLIALMSITLVYWLTIGLATVMRARRIGPGWSSAALLLAMAWLALFELRMIGTLPLLSSMAIVWLADIGAYASGRALGRHKLAPRVSPGKTWEGALGGMVAVWVAAVLVSVAAPVGQTNLAGPTGVLSNALISGVGWLGGGCVLAGLVALSIVGDLYESLLKREAGVKDSGRLLPGHGGILDRIDALIPAMPGCLLVYHVLG